MGFDFSAVDAELSALGASPSDLAALAARDVGPLDDLADVDRALAALGEPVEPSQFAIALDIARAEPSLAAESSASAPAELAQATALPPVAWPSASLSSGEISLPEPVQLSSTPAVAYEDLTIAVSEPPPESGSYALHQVAHEPSREDRESPGPALLADQPTTSDGTLGDSDVDDVLALFDESMSGADEAPSRPLNGLSDLESAGLSLAAANAALSDRDPDAEFDALFSDATSPSGIPTRSLGLEDETPNADDLLVGLESNASEASAAMDELYSETEEHTAVLDQNTIDSITSSAPPAAENPFGENELGSSEFEILLDESAETSTELEGHALSAAEAGGGKIPPPPPSAGEKRPSFLGRLFGRKEPT